VPGVRTGDLVDVLAALRRGEVLADLQGTTSSNSRGSSSSRRNMPDATRHAGDCC
jgi:hypothetical protein